MWMNLIWPLFFSMHQLSKIIFYAIIFVHWYITFSSHLILLFKLWPLHVDSLCSWDEKFPLPALPD